MKEFKLYAINLNGIGKTYLTSVFFNKSFSADEVKTRLVHNGSFKSDILVRKY